MEANMRRLTSKLPDVIRNPHVFFNNRFHQPHSQRTMPIASPSTGETVGEAALSNEQDVDAAVSAAQAAFPAWRDKSMAERSRLLLDVSYALKQNAQELAELDTLNTGSPIEVMLGDLAAASQRFSVYAGLGFELKGETVPIDARHLDFTVRHPLGVCAQLASFNRPAMFVSWLTAAPLIAGNTVVYKPANWTPLSAMRIAQIVSDILPDGVFNLVTGDASTGSLLVNHPDVKKISLIGSKDTGAKIRVEAAAGFKPVSMELGGKNPFIAFPDVDPDVLAHYAVDGMNYRWAGQSCCSTSRVFLHEDIHDEVLAKMVAKANAIVPSSPFNMDCQMGSLVSEPHYSRVKGYIQAGIDEGATLECGGEHPNTEATEGGLFLRPTIFSNVTDDMTIAREEIFGPVMSVLKWEDPEEVIERANRLEYGLSASVWCNNTTEGFEAVKKVHSGYKWLNAPAKHHMGVPFGGSKRSGVGKFACLADIESFTQVENVNVGLGFTK